jgi:hypothetical protein
MGRGSLGQATMLAFLFLATVPPEACIAEDKAGDRLMAETKSA